MCCCGKPTKNGEPGYSWDGKSFGVYPISAPDVPEGASLIFDEPGRCGGLDSHCHHFRVVKHYGCVLLLTRNGGGVRSMEMGWRPALLDALSGMTSDDRYWMLQAIYSAIRNAESAARDNEAHKWRVAAAEKRIKTRKLPAQKQTKVWIVA